MRPTWAEINISNLRENYRNIKKLVKEDTKICGVVKANAYGHGSVYIAKVLVEEGVDYLAVATLEEALELRLNHITIPILCLGYINETDIQIALNQDIDITVYSYNMAKNISKLAKNLNKKCNIHIKIDTGMSRLGFKANNETVEIIEKIYSLPEINIVGIYTHFARADEIDKTFTHSQFEEFMYIIDKLKEKNIKIPIKHAANSAALIDLPQYHLDMVRPGIILYGHYPSEDVNKEKIDLKPVMSLKTKVSNIKVLDSKRGVGYGHAYVTSENEKIATLPIGYADGFTRMLSLSADVKINGKKFPVVGRICMDQCMIQVNNANIKVGDEVLIFGEDEDLRIERFGKILKTINYELLCMVSRRVPRVYLEGNRVLHILDYLLK
ncbi:alanine racemase [Alkalithermobacter thermoalcaliphilus JW-YL-7 = DSM 7308]|uniref:Alanine racemase n=1 Tax=Alkalithermobacter thermoalcaliphilus JW-YL-7 = DSM 7308 TaxID=1121328 RepID=A0A150FTL3_CLOPD|nr:Alanine racemase [[Clostridium] paradoxum JW-YL-7 = DSM 7308]SHK72281.1 alanine racemase [[Clostridium] paradoxum JW-YL-7 = DSM 7308]